MGLEVWILMPVINRIKDARNNLTVAEKKRRNKHIFWLFKKMEFDGIVFNQKSCNCSFMLPWMGHNSCFSKATKKAKTAHNSCELNHHYIRTYSKKLFPSSWSILTLFLGVKKHAKWEFSIFAYSINFF